MPKVKYIRPSRDGSRLIIGIIEGDRARGYYVSRTLPEDLSVYVGRDLSRMEFDAITREDEKYRAMKKALSILSISDNAEKALYMKLVRHGYSRDVASECALECLSLGYIDEHRQLTILAKREANSALRGRAYIVKKLSAKGYRKGQIIEVIDELESSGEIDFSLNFERLKEKMGVLSDEEILVLKYKYGYRTSDFD